MSEEVPSEFPEKGTLMKKYNNISQPDLLGYLSTAYEVLRRVFSFLYLDDVKNAAEAFESWRTVADVTVKERNVIESFVLSNEYYKVNIWSEATFCMCFCTAYNEKYVEQITKYISPNGEFLVCVSGAGVIGTSNDLSQIVQQRFKTRMCLDPFKLYLTALRIPHIPEVGIKTFVWEENISFRDFRNRFDIPENQKIKCLLILMVAEGSGRVATKQKDDFIRFLEWRQKESFAIGGCVVDNIVNYTKAHPSNSVIKYIVFFGENVEAASTVLTIDIKSHESVFSKIKSLWEMSPSTERGVLMVFRCAGRQGFRKIHKLKNDIAKWEADAIQKYFPNTPVVGCFGYGEFGKEHPYVHTSASKKRMKMTEYCEYNFSTSVVYVGFKK